MAKHKNLIVLTILFIICGVSLVSAETIRTATSKKDCNGNVCSISYYPGPVNYHDGQSYVPIDQTIKTSSHINYDYEVTTGIYHAFFKQDPTEGQVVMFEYNNSQITFQPMALNYRNDLNQLEQIQMISSVTGSPNYNEFIYEDAYGSGIDLKYKYLNTQLKESLVIDSALPSPAQYIIDGGNPTLDLDFIISADSKIVIDGVEWDKSSTVETTNSVLIKDTSDNLLYSLPRPYAIDNNNDRKLLKYQFKKTGNSLYVIIKTNYTWINNAAYPVEIDPSTTLDSSSGDGYLYAYSTVAGSNEYWDYIHDNTTAQLNYSRTESIALYSYETSNKYYLTRVFFPFDTSSLPDNINITNASLHFNISNIGSQNFGTRTIAVVNTNQSDSNIDELYLSDFVNTGTTNNPAEGAERVDGSTAGVKIFYLNSTGSDWINTSGYTKLGLRTLLDVEDTDPLDNNREITVDIDSSESDSPPYLNITYNRILPNVTLNAPSDGASLLFRNRPFEFNFTTITDYYNIVNASIYGNWTGTWHLNQTNTTTIINGSVYNFTGINVTRHIGNVWNVEVCLSSTECSFASSNFTLEVNNTAPTLTNVELNKTSGVTNDMDLLCNISGETDLDNDSITEYYEWYNDSTAMDINISVLRNGNLTDNSTWSCEGWVGDGLDNSSKYTSSSVNVNASSVTPSIDNYNATTAATNVNSTSADPTNNNSYINFSVVFTDSNSDQWTAYFCTSPTWSTCLANASGELYCRSVVNSTEKVLSCQYNVTGQGLGGEYTYYSYVLDSTSLVSSGQSNTFEVNRPPTVPSITTPSDASYLTVNYTTLAYSSTDLDSDGINYTIYNSSDGISYEILTTNTTYYWDNLSDGTYYLIAYSSDHHDYSLEENNTVTSFIVDTTDPAYNRIYASSYSASTSDSVIFYANVTDTNVGTATSCEFTFKKSGYQDGDAFNQTTNTKSGDLFSVSLPMSTYQTGILQWTHAYCTDLASNTAVNSSVNLNITISSPSVGSTGGGGSSTIIQTTDVTQAVTETFAAAAICGNNVCQSGENPLNCPQDCQANLDELFCLFKQDGGECPAWAFTALMVIIMLVFVGVPYLKQTGRI